VCRIEKAKLSYLELKEAPIKTKRKHVAIQTMRSCVVRNIRCCFVVFLESYTLVYQVWSHSRRNFAVVVVVGGGGVVEVMVMSTHFHELP